MRRCQNIRGGNNVESRECASGTLRGSQCYTVTVREVKPSNFSNRIFRWFGSIQQIRPTKANRVRSFTAENGTGAASAMGKDERSSAETQAHNLSSRTKADRSGAAGEVGEGEGGEEDCLEPTEPAACMRQALGLGAG